MDVDMKAFCTDTMARARFGDEEEAERTAIESVAVLARSLPHALAMEVAARLPDQLGETMRIAAGDGEINDPTGSDIGPDAGMPEDWPAITPDEPFDWGVWGELPDGEGVHHADPTQEPAEEAYGDPIVDAQDFIGPAINMMETESATIRLLADGIWYRSRWETTPSHAWRQCSTQSAGVSAPT